MDTISDTQRDEAYANATAAQKFLYSSPASGARLYDIAQKHGLHENNNYRKFAITVGDAVLSLVKTGDLPELMQTQFALNETAAKNLVIDLLDYLTMSPAESAEKRTNTPLAKTEITEPVYTSTQSAILHESRTATGATVAKWDTEESNPVS